MTSDRTADGRDHDKQGGQVLPFVPAKDRETRKALERIRRIVMAAYHEKVKEQEKDER